MNPSAARPTAVAATGTPAPPYPATTAPPRAPATAVPTYSPPVLRARASVPAFPARNSSRALIGAANPQAANPHRARTPARAQVGTLVGSASRTRRRLFPTIPAKVPSRTRSAPQRSVALPHRKVPTAPAAPTTAISGARAAPPVPVRSRVIGAT